MRTIIRDNYDPKNGDYHEKIIIDEARGRRWLFDCDGVFMPFDGVEVVNERGSSTSKAVSQKLFTDTANELEGADATLQQEIDELKNSPDVVDIVGTYADLQSYDTSTLGDKDVIRVLVDETHDNESSYYRWNATPQTWTFIGAVEGYYTKDQTDDLLDEKQDKLTAGSNINIDADNVISGAYTHFTGATASTDGIQGLVPGPLAGDEGKFLQGDGTWGTPTGATYTAGTNVQISSGNVISATDTTYSDFVGATSSEAGTAGLVPAPALGEVDKYLKSDGSWATVSSYSLPAATANTLGGVKIGSNLSMDSNDVLSATDTTYSNFVGTDGTAAGTAGLVPAPATTDAGKFLKADGTWDTAGSAVNVVQTTGTSTTDVMSQKATTSMIFRDPSSRENIQIGNSSYSNGLYGVAIGYSSYVSAPHGIAMGYSAKAYDYPANTGEDIAIGYNAQSNAYYSIAIGPQATSSKASASSGAHDIAIGYKASAGATNNSVSYAMAIGDQAKAEYSGCVSLGAYSGNNLSATGMIDVGSSNTSYGYSSSNYRLLTGLYDPQSAHDAATKGYVDTAVAGAGATITMTTTDPGEGAALTANNFVAVYDEAPLNLDYSTSEVDTGTVWIDGSTIFKKTIDIGTPADSATKLVAHNISNLGTVIKMEGMLNGPSIVPLPFPSTSSSSNNVEIVLDTTNIRVITGSSWWNSNNYVGHITLYYTKSS